jgi:hypothetical protein
LQFGAITPVLLITVGLHRDHFSCRYFCVYICLHIALFAERSIITSFFVNLSTHGTSCRYVFRRASKGGQCYPPIRCYCSPPSFRQTFTQASVTSSWTVSNSRRCLDVGAILHPMTFEQSPLSPATERWRSKLKVSANSEENRQRY